jgi:hypothetical protein
MIWPSADENNKPKGSGEIPRLLFSVLTAGGRYFDKEIE